VNRSWLRLDPGRRSTLPEPLLREVAGELGTKRCSADYLEALAVTLGNMAAADRLGASLRLPVAVPFATPRTMRTILERLESAGRVERCSLTDSKGRPHEVRVYRGMAAREPAADLFERLQREAEAADFERQMQALGIQADDCPH